MFCNNLNLDQKALACEIINKTKQQQSLANINNLHWFKLDFFMFCVQQQEKNLSDDGIQVIQEIINNLNTINNLAPE